VGAGADDEALGQLVDRRREVGERDPVPVVPPPAAHDPAGEDDGLPPLRRRAGGRLLGRWLALASACEEAGLEGLFSSDHYLATIGAEERGGLDAWARLVWLDVKASSQTDARGRFFEEGLGRPWPT